MALLEFISRLFHLIDIIWVDLETIPQLNKHARIVSPVSKHECGMDHWMFYDEML